MLLGDSGQNQTFVLGGAETGSPWAQILAGHGEEAGRVLLDSRHMGWLIGPRARPKRKVEKLEVT